jgi:hypothetical protein
MSDFMRVCKISYFEKRHNQLLYERIHKLSMAVALTGKTPATQCLQIATLIVNSAA